MIRSLVGSGTPRLAVRMGAQVAGRSVPASAVWFIVRGASCAMTTWSLPQCRMVAIALVGRLPRAGAAVRGGRCSVAGSLSATAQLVAWSPPALWALVAWSPDTSTLPASRGRRGRLQEGHAWPAAVGRVQPAQVLAADLTGQPGAELLADVGHRGPGERAGLLDAQPTKLQALDA